MFKSITSKVLLGLGILTLITSIILMQHPGPLRVIGVSVWAVLLVGVVLSVTGVINGIKDKLFPSSTTPVTPTPLYRTRVPKDEV